MAFDMNTLETQKGVYGQELAMSFLRNRGYDVRDMKVSEGVFDVDFEITDDKGRKMFVEVKTYSSSQMYGVGRTFAIRDDLLNVAQNYAWHNDLPLSFMFIDDMTGKAYLQNTNVLFAVKEIYGIKFPTQIYFSPQDESQPAHVFHVDQFINFATLSEKQIEKLRSYSPNKIYPPIKNDTSRKSAEIIQADAITTKLPPPPADQSGETPEIPTIPHDTLKKIQTIKASDSRKLIVWFAPNGKFWLRASELNVFLGYDPTVNLKTSPVCKKAMEVNGVAFSDFHGSRKSVLLDFGKLVRHVFPVIINGGYKQMRKKFKKIFPARYERLRIAYVDLTGKDVPPISAPTENLKRDSATDKPAENLSNREQTGVTLTSTEAGRIYSLLYEIQNILFNAAQKITPVKADDNNTTRIITQAHEINIKDFQGDTPF